MYSTDFLKLLVFLFSFMWLCYSPILCSMDSGRDNTVYRYSRDALLILQNQSLNSLSLIEVNLPDEISPTDNDNNRRQTNRKLRHRRGRRGGVKRRHRQNIKQLPLPTVIFANVRSIRPNGRNLNFDELCANVKYVNEFRNSCLLCFSETWLCDKITDESMSIDGFGEPFRLDREKTASGKRSGGGVCLYVNPGWCTRENVCVKKTLCTENVELLSVSMRPRYLPRKFGRVFVTVCYVCPDISGAVRDIQSLYPGAPCFILDDSL